MKLLITLSFSLFLMGTAFSQEMDKRLLERYSQSELTSMMSTDKQQYDMLVYALDHAIYTTHRAEGKLANLPSISLKAGGENFIELGLEIKDENQYFLIEATDAMLVVKSSWVLKHEMKKQ